MVFMDAQGTKIQDSVSRDLLKILNLSLEEGGFYYISYVLVVANDGNDRPTRHAYRLVIESRSHVVKAERLTYTKFGLSPLTCSDLVRTKKDTKHLVDKVGLLTSISCEREYTKDDKDILAIYMEIIDPHVVKFLRSNGPCTPIIVVQMARIVPDAQVLFGNVGIETVQHVSRILFNPPLPDVLDMHEWLLLSGITVDGRIQYRNLEIPCVSLWDEFLYYYHKKDIGELNKQGKGGCFVICATITSLVENEARWYLACRPHACSSMASSIYTCDGDFSIIPKFSVKVEVSDRIENSQSTNYPDVFNRLIGKRMLFVVETKSFTDVHEGCFKGSATFMSSSVASASINNFTLPMSSSPQVGPPIDKQCLHFT
ncbi:hypothetical protein SESBI_24273 [Sesbania bispinosa]|nr:hypothetical protein SESBI_24273 [Sesbania bispinosa]